MYEFNSESILYVGIINRRPNKLPWGTHESCRLYRLPYKGAVDVLFIQLYYLKIHLINKLPL